MRQIPQLVFFVCISLITTSCFGQPLAEKKTPVYSYKIMNTYPHDTQAFTQGLIYHKGVLYESTGLNGQSSLRKIKFETGEVLQKERLPHQYFGEGLAIWGTELIQLTWESQVAFVYDLTTFKQTRKFTYTGEGWGLTTDGMNFILSDGTADLRFMSSQTFKETRRITVTDNGQIIKNLNELEYIQGYIYANIWFQDRIAKIDPINGKVVAWLDLSDLVPRHLRGSQDAVLNGIAYDAKGDRLFITGKLWPVLYEIKIVETKVP